MIQKNNALPSDVVFGLFEKFGKQAYTAPITQHIERPFIAEHFDKQNQLYAGFQAELDVSQVEPGEYWLQMVIEDETANYGCPHVLQVTVLENEPESISPLIKAEQIEAHEAYSSTTSKSSFCLMERVQDRRINEQSLIKVKVGQALILEGWSIDFHKHVQPPSEILIKLTNEDSLGERHFKSVIILKRHDITEKLNLDEHLNAGVVFNIDTQLLSPGLYSVEFLMPRMRGLSVCHIQNKIQVI